MLRLVVVPCLNAHKRHVRDPLYSFNSLLRLLTEPTNGGIRWHSRWINMLKKWGEPGEERHWERVLGQATSGSIM